MPSVGCGAASPEEASPCKIEWMFLFVPTKRPGIGGCRTVKHRAWNSFHLTMLQHETLRMTGVVVQTLQDSVLQSVRSAKAAKRDLSGLLLAALWCTALSRISRYIQEEFLVTHHYPALLALSVCPDHYFHTCLHPLSTRR